MKSRTLLTLTMLLITSGLLVAQASFQLKDSKISIQGTSNIHDWESAVTQVKAEGTLTVEDNLLKALPALKVTMAVEGIESSKGSVMDKKTYKALLYEEHPNIIFELKKLTGLKPTADQQNLTASGNLTIAGTTKLVDMKVIAEKTAAGDFRFTGSKALKMTDFNMEPPTALFGSLKTGDDVTVTFDITLTSDSDTSSLK